MRFVLVLKFEFFRVIRVIFVYRFNHLSSINSCCCLHEIDTQTTNIHSHLLICLFAGFDLRFSMASKFDSIIDITPEKETWTIPARVVRL